MVTKDKATALIISALHDIIDTLPEDQKFVPTSDTKLFGAGSSIDSLTLVSFIVELEEKLTDEFDIQITLTDDRAMTREKSPFDSINDLSDYIVEITNDPNNV